MRSILKPGGIVLALFVSALCLFSASHARRPAIVFAAENAESAADAGPLFAKHCAGCHGKDGRAKTLKGKLTHARNIADAAWQNQVSDERIFNSINNGRGSKMPRFDKKLSENQIDELVTYVRQLKK